MKEIYPLIKNRHTTREFSREKISESDLHAVLEAGRWAPSSLNIQPWHFIVIQDQKVIRLIWNASYYYHVEHDKKSSNLPSIMIAIVIDKLAKPASQWAGHFENKFSPGLPYLNAAMPALNMVYQANALGLAAGFKTPVALELGGILKLPYGHECPIIVTLGYPATSHQPIDRERKPLGELLYYEKFGRKKKNAFF